MRLGWLWVFAMACGLPFSAMAAPIAVQSGEHGKFTRLVTPLPSGKEWSITQTGNEITLTIEDHNDGFNTTTVYDLIPRDRISGLVSDANTLTLTLACDCEVAAFLEKDRFVVVDVAAKDVTLAGSPVPHEVVATAPRMASAVPTPTRPTSLQVFPTLPPTSQVTTSSLNFPQQVLDRPNLNNVEQEVLAEMQLRLVQELGTAATRGFLSPAPGRQTKTEQHVPMSDSIVPTALPASVEPALGVKANVRISSSLDLPPGINPGRSTLEIAGLSCPPPGALDVSTWGTEQPFSEQLGAARDGLFNELDRLDHVAATRLAQRYLFFGFGAEARQILELDPALAQTQTPLLIMADILDEKPPRNASVLARKANCDPEVVLWATLAQPYPVTGAKPDTDAALRALNKLPVHLRQILAPALSQKLLAYGDEESAAFALRSLTRLPDQLQPAAQLAQAEISLHGGHIERGAAQLEDVAQENAAQSPVALIALVDARIGDQQPIDIDVANLVAAYAHELRGTELGPEMRRAHILALLKSGQFDKAFQTSKDLGGDEDTKSARELRAQLFRELTSTADDIVFLDHIFAQREADIALLPTRDLTALAARFLATGFPQRAESTLSHLPQQSLEPEQKILAARVAMALEKPNAAQANLLGTEGKEADSLRADAKRMAGEHEEAHVLYARTAQLQQAAETAWLAENWRGLTPAETPIFGAASSLAAQVNDLDIGINGMLARTVATLEESEAARQTLADLLNAKELRVQPTN